MVSIDGHSGGLRMPHESVDVELVIVYIFVFYLKPLNN